MITNIDKAIRVMFGIYFQRSFDPDLHENCPGCKRELSTEEMEKDLKYQEKLAELFSSKIKESFFEEEILHIANKLSDPSILRFMETAFVFCGKDAQELRDSVFGNDEPDDGHDERRIV
ncbi:MAG TPA: hypothetical protein VJH05_01845 [Candidatus Paceibacterota bacterium]